MSESGVGHVTRYLSLVSRVAGRHMAACDHTYLPKAHTDTEAHTCTHSHTHTHPHMRPRIHTRARPLRLTGKDDVEQDADDGAEQRHWLQHEGHVVVNEGPVRGLWVPLPDVHAVRSNRQAKNRAWKEKGRMESAKQAARSAIAVTRRVRVCVYVCMCVCVCERVRKGERREGRERHVGEEEDVSFLHETGLLRRPFPPPLSLYLSRVSITPISTGLYCPPLRLFFPLDQ